MFKFDDDYNSDDNNDGVSEWAKIYTRIYDDDKLLAFMFNVHANVSPMCVSAQSEKVKMPTELMDWVDCDILEFPEFCIRYVSVDNEIYPLD